jgi:hypothetical protein
MAKTINTALSVSTPRFSGDRTSHHPHWTIWSITSPQGLLRPALIKPIESESDAETESPLEQPAGEIPF